jgi:hypothetical protein
VVGGQEGFAAVVEVLVDVVLLVLVVLLVVVKALVVVLVWVLVVCIRRGAYLGRPFAGIINLNQ